jgi:hypothetical protein
MGKTALVLALALMAQTALGSPAETRAELESTALCYFLENAHPRTGLVRDNALNFAPTPDTPPYRRASIAATGFGLAVIVNAAERGMLPCEYAQDYARRVLSFVRDHVAARKGWLLHFIDWETGERVGQSEFSTIDTALFLAGALYAGQVYAHTPIAALAQELYERVDFIDMLTDGGAQPDKLTLTSSYRPERGYSQFQWSHYAEHMLLLLLGLGHPTHPLPTKTWYAWERQSITLPSGEELIGYNEPLFTHLYSQLFVDFRQFRDAYGNYFENGRLATLFNWDTCRGDKRFETFREGFWGLSAGDSPDGYRAFSPVRYNGTVCPGCAVASVIYLPDMVLADAEGWMSGPYRDRIWGRYGFADSLNLDRDWVSQRVYGITVGPLFLALANMDEATSIWKTFNHISAIHRALARLGACW